jgi:hypothetical protein
LPNIEVTGSKEKWSKKFAFAIDPFQAKSLKGMIFPINQGSWELQFGPKIMGITKPKKSL